MGDGAIPVPSVEGSSALEEGTVPPTTVLSGGTVPVITVEEDDITSNGDKGK